MNNNFDFNASGRTISGAESSKEIGRILDSYAKKRIFLIMDSGIVNSGIGEKILGYLSKSGISVDSYTDIPREPGVPDVDAVVEKAKAYKPDGVVAIGGGSVLDIGKLLSVLIHSDKNVLQLLDGADVPEHSVFTALIPTTAGTGSEATKNSIIAIPDRGTKSAVISGRLLPDLVFLDPVLTTTLPSGITATTGMDALCHAIECFLSVKANSMSDLLALDSIKRIAQNLRKAFKNSDDLEARWNMLIASNFAGMCISLSGTNAVHAMSYPLGTVFHIPHGQANAMLLPSVMEINLTADIAKTTLVAECFGYDNTNTEIDPVEYLTRELHQLLKDLEIISSLAAFNVTAADIPALVENAYQNRRLMDNNPIELSKEQIESIYMKLLGEK